MSEKRKQSKTKLTIVIVAILVTAGVAAGIYFALNAIYNNGRNDGYQTAIVDMSDKVKNLGAAVGAKANFAEKSYSTLMDMPETLNTESIDAYITKLNELKSENSSEEIRLLLDDYLAKWTTFKDVYAGKNNSEIQESFNALKMATDETAGKIQTIFDNNIQEAIRNL